MIRKDGSGYWELHLTAACERRGSQAVVEHAREEPGVSISMRLNPRTRCA